MDHRSVLPPGSELSFPGMVCRIDGCAGRGYRECELCMGLGICGVCFGRPRDYVPSYDGTGGSDVTCAGCHGSGRCEYCGGTGRQACMWCDGGVCRTCHGLAVSGAD